MARWDESGKEDFNSTLKHIGPDFLENITLESNTLENITLENITLKSIFLENITFENITLELKVLVLNWKYYYRTDCDCELCRRLLTLLGFLNQRVSMYKFTTEGY